MLINKNECLRCGCEMKSVGIEKIQLGQTGLFLGSLNNILSGSLEVEIYICGSCGKVEFYSREGQYDGDNLMQVECPNCGKQHDFDYPKCPHCGYKVKVNSDDIEV